jgi:signal transduction histidine kinase
MEHLAGMRSPLYRMPVEGSDDVLWVELIRSEVQMRLKTWLVAALGLGSLVVLIAVSMLASSRKTQAIYAQLDQLNTHHRNVEAKLRALRSDVHLSSIFVRDYLLDVARERAPEYREQLAEFRRTSVATLEELRPLVGHDDQISSLQTKLAEYWETFDPLFDWTPTEKIIRSATFLRREVVPRREAILSIARGIEELNNQNLAAQSAEVASRHTALRNDLRRLTWQTVLLGLAVALIVVFRLRVLERHSEEAEQQMRELSQQLVNTQEEERKSLSRELHDHVAQVLTGLRMELGRVERIAAPLDARIGPAVAECRGLVDDMFKTVRGLALGLRPSMLDDFGLQAALEWHVRDFTGRYAMDVDLKVDGDLEALPDKHRTCAYRVVQEALTNCARHAQAQNVKVRVQARDGRLQVSVTDDGVGLNPISRRAGLGLRGIDERVRELAGTMTISPEAGGGTTVAVQLPLPANITEVSRARAVS